jgi:hypothetical protein
MLFPLKDALELAILTSLSETLYSVVIGPKSFTLWTAQSLVVNLRHAHALAFRCLGQGTGLLRHLSPANAKNEPNIILRHYPIKDSFIPLHTIPDWAGH